MPAYNDANFRLLFKAFADTTTYPQAMLSMYWDVGRDYIGVKDSPCYMLNGSSLQLALDLICAHLTTLFTADANNVQAGDSPGVAGTIETSATVGSVSVSNLPPPVKDAWDYWLNQTSYGQQLLALLKMKSVGGFSVGGLPEGEAFRRVGGVFW